MNMLESWLIASADLDFLFTPGAVVATPGAEPARFLFVVHAFGSPRGTLVHAASGDLARMHDVAARAGFHTCYLDPADYEEYDRERFMRILKEWGWQGSGPPPAWYMT